MLSDFREDRRDAMEVAGSGLAEIVGAVDPHIEVVLLEADSRETLLTTHASYFKTVAEIARSL